MGWSGAEMFQSECAVGVMPALRLTHHLLSYCVRIKCGRRRVGWGNDANFNKCLLKTESEKVSPKLLFQRVAKPEKVPFHVSEARLAAEGGFLAVQTRLPCIADKPCL